ncbi:MAG TPA: lysophospholipid acyltransferase family protein [Planctomycetota bacterium]
MAEAGTRAGADAADPDGWPVPWQPVWGESAGLGSRLGAWCVQAALAGAIRLPQAPLDALIAALAALGHRLGRARTRAAHEFLAQALGELSAGERERLTRAAWRQLLRVSVDTERLLRRVPPERLLAHFEVETSPEARAAFAARRGVLIAGPHLGNWEVALFALPLLGLVPAYAVAKPPKNRFLAQALQASRERRGVRILSRKGAMNDAPAILKAGGALALVIDQRTSGRALLAPFFGRLARCERAPAVLLKRQRVPIVLTACLQAAEPLRYHLRFGEVLHPDEWARAEVEAIVRRVNEGFERMIRAHPEQYIWIHDRYRDTPRAQPPGAGPRLARRAAPPAVPEGPDEG